MAYTNITIDATKTVRFNEGGKFYLYNSASANFFVARKKSNGAEPSGGRIGDITNGETVYLTGLTPGTTYELYENYSWDYYYDYGTYDSKGYHYIATFTTAPSKPVLKNYSVAGNTLAFEWELEYYYGGNWTRIYINLYRADNLTSIYKSLVVYADDVGDNTYYGTAYFTNVESGDYVIKAQTIYEINGVEIPCCVDREYVPSDADSSTNVSYTFISEVLTVERAKWKYSYIDSNNNPVLGENKQIEANNKYFYITAEEWNALCDFVKGKWSNGYYSKWTIGDNQYGYAPTTTMKQIAEDAKVEQNESVSAHKFNILRECIGSFCTESQTGISTIYKTNDDMKIEEFNILKDKANLMR